MSKNLFAPMTEEEKFVALGVTAPQSVQSSLYQRLKRTWGKRSGAIAWTLVRAGQARHGAHAEAVAALREATNEQLLTLWDAVLASLERPKDDACKGLLGEIRVQVQAAMRDVARATPVVADENGVIDEPSLSEEQIARMGAEWKKRKATAE